MHLCKSFTKCYEKLLSDQSTKRKLMHWMPIATKPLNWKWLGLWAILERHQQNVTYGQNARDFFPHFLISN